MRIFLVLFLSLFFITPNAFAQEADVPIPKSFKEAYAGYNKYADAADDKGARLRTHYAQKAYDLGLKRFGPNSINTANLVVNWVFAFDVFEGEESPIKPFFKIENAYEKKNKDNPALLIEVYTSFGNILFKNSINKSRLKNVETGLDSYQFAINTAQEHYGKGSYQLAKLHLHVGMILQRYEVKISNKNFLNDAFLFFKDHQIEYKLEYALVNFRQAEALLSKRKYSQAKDKMTIALDFFDLEKPDNELTKNGHYVMMNILALQNNLNEAKSHCNIPSPKKILANRHPKPTLKYQPKFPKKLTKSPHSGFVIVEFNVTEEGKVSKPLVLCSYPKNYLEKSVLNAVSKFTYDPALINGKPVETLGLRNTINYEIEKYENSLSISFLIEENESMIETELTKKLREKIAAKKEKEFKAPTPPKPKVKN